MKLKIGLLGLLCLYFTAGAWGVSAIKGLSVGDRVPDVTVGEVVNWDGRPFRFSDFKGKVLILDFWACWCGSCLHHFPAADSLQREFRGDLAIVLVNTRSTRDSRERILSVLRRFDVPGRRFGLPSVVGDTVLDALFPHYQLPHYVWIDREGVVRSVTSAEELTRANVLRFIRQGELRVDQKADFNPRVPLYTSPGLPLDHLQHYSILLKGKIDGIGQGGIRFIHDTARGVILHNKPLLGMYQRVLAARVPGLNGHRLLLEVKDSSGLSSRFSGLPGGRWEREYEYSYELVVPAAEMPRVYDYMLEDLNRYTDYTAGFERRRVRCWILAKGEGFKLSAGEGRKALVALDDPLDARLVHGSLFELCLYIGRVSGNVVLDETGLSLPVDLDFKQPVKDLGTMQRLLKRFGLRLYEADRGIEVLVVRDRKY